MPPRRKKNVYLPIALGSAVVLAIAIGAASYLSNRGNDDSDQGPHASPGGPAPAPTATPLGPPAACSRRGYQAFIRTDPQCVAATLAARFGETAAHHYRFGLVVGYVVPARAGNFGALFPAELRHYGQLAGIPDTLFQPLTQEVLPGPIGAAPAQLLASIVEQLDSYILATE